MAPARLGEKTGFDFVLDCGPDVEPTYRNTTLNRMLRWAFGLVLALALTSSFIACTKDLPAPTPTVVQQIVFAPQTTATTQTSVTPVATSPAHAPAPEQTVRGGPAPRIFEIEWNADKGSIAPGEPFTIRLRLKNVWDDPVEFNEFPSSMTLIHVDTRTETSVPIELESGEETPGSLATGEALVVIASVPTRVSAGLHSGRHRVTRFLFTYTPGGPGSGQTRTHLSSEALFVVSPPEGALDRTLVVGQEREAGGARITLEKVHFTPEQTTVSVFAATLTQSTAEPQAAVDGTSTPVPPTQPRSTPTPVSMGASLPWDGDITDLTAFYSLDGGMWRLIVNYSYREGPDGVHHEWSFDPVPIGVRTLEFVIVPRSRPGQDGTFTYPAEGGSSSWEWVLPLQRPDLMYSKGDLTEWHRTLRDVIWQVPGMAYVYLDEPANRIKIGMEPRRGAREEMEAAIESVGVPRGAASIDVGCSGVKPWPLDNGNPPNEEFLRAIEYSLDMADQASYGEAVGMTLTLRNVSDEPVNFSTGGRPPHDFVISTAEGEQVWHWKCGKIIQQPLDSQTLEPGEELEFTGEWEQVDNRGEPVPPGAYLVRGVLDMEPPETFVTETQELEIVR